MMRVGGTAASLARRHGARAFATYTSGVKPTLYFSDAQPSNVTVTEKEWTQLVASVFGAPLTDYYASRYPGFSVDDLEAARGELRGAFLIQGDWRKKYAEINAPEELYKCRARLEAELDPANIEKLQALAEDQDPATADPFIALRLKDAQQAQASVSESPGSLSAPEFDWDAEYKNNKLAASEKRARYERLGQASLEWEAQLPSKWAAPFNQCTSDLHKDIDIDYLRYLEGHINDQVRAEKWYTRLSEDGEETLTYEEVEAWLPEYYDTLMVDYDNWWEMVSRGTDASQWDRYAATYEQHHQAIAEKYSEEKAIAEDNERLSAFFSPKSLFQSFRQPPVVDAAFVKAAGILPPQEEAVQVEAAKTA